MSPVSRIHGWPLTPMHAKFPSCILSCSSTSMILFLDTTTTAGIVNHNQCQNISIPQRKSSHQFHLHYMQVSFTYFGLFSYYLLTFSTYKILSTGFGSLYLSLSMWFFLELMFVFRCFQLHILSDSILTVHLTGILQMRKFKLIYLRKCRYP